MVLSRFNGEAWSSPQVTTSVAGIYPRFIQGASTPTLSFRNATHRDWAYLQLDAQGATTGVAALVGAIDQRPQAISESIAGMAFNSEANPAAPSTSASPASASAASTAATGASTRNQTVEDPTDMTPVARSFSWHRP